MCLSKPGTWAAVRSDRRAWIGRDPSPCGRPKLPAELLDIFDEDSCRNVGWPTRAPGNTEAVSSDGRPEPPLGWLVMPCLASSISDKDGSSCGSVASLRFFPRAEDNCREWRCRDSVGLPPSNCIVRGESPDSSKDNCVDIGVWAVEEYCDPAMEAVESIRSLRVGGGSLPRRCSLLLPLPLLEFEFAVCGVALLLVLPWRNLAGSALLRLEGSWPVR